MVCRFARAAAFGLAASWAAACGAATPGEDLYLGRASLQASLRGDDSLLPPAAVICANCHEPSARPGGTREALAPRLDARLKDALPRRGGPPHAYDEAAFCRVLRKGLDPADVLLRRAMPRFDASAPQCAALWDFVSRREPLAEGAP